MLPADDLAFAIEIQQKSYRLLRWVADAVDTGIVAAQTVSHHSDGPEAAIDWVRRYHGTFPREIQVESADRDALASFFWTYVVSSFDVDVEAGTRGAAGTHGCTCDLCVRLVDAGHLRTKKLRAYDKRRALDLMVRRGAALASEHDHSIDDEIARSYLDDAGLRRAMGYSAYGETLLERLGGTVEGPVVLALWREIAWSRQGSPLKDFTLDVGDFVTAERLILDTVDAASP